MGPALRLRRQCHEVAPVDPLNLRCERPQQRWVSARHPRRELEQDHCLPGEQEVAADLLIELGKRHGIPRALEVPNEEVEQDTGREVGHHPNLPALQSSGSRSHGERDNPSL